MTKKACTEVTYMQPTPTKFKRPMDHIAHLRKQFKSINTYDYIITLIKRIKNERNSE